MYKLVKSLTSGEISFVQKDASFIPFAPANTDYQQFKVDVLTGAELQDADGTPMSQEAATAFIGTLP